MVGITKMLPDAKLVDQYGEEVSPLSQLRERPTVMAFTGTIAERIVAMTI